MKLPVKNYLIKLIIFITLFFPLNGAYSGGKEFTLGLADIKHKLVQFLFLKHDNFKLTEIYSNEEVSQEFVTRSLGPNFTLGAIQIESKNYYFSDMESTSSTHFGILIIHYDEKKHAKKVFDVIKTEGFFSGTKILTKYVVKNEGHKNIVLYTESAMDGLATEFIRSYLGQ